MAGSKSPIVKLAMFCPCLFSSLISLPIFIISEPLSVWASTDTLMSYIFIKAQIYTILYERAGANGNIHVLRRVIARTLIYEGNKNGQSMCFALFCYIN